MVTKNNQARVAKGWADLTQLMSKSILVFVSLLALTVSGPKSVRADSGGLFVFMGPHFVLNVAKWASLDRYGRENAALANYAPTSGGIVLFGDSIFDLWDEPPNDSVYPRALINRGVSAQTTFQMLMRFRSDVINIKPTYVIINAGTNDIADLAGKMDMHAIQENMSSMAELARFHGIKVVLTTVLPVCDCKKLGNGNLILQTQHRLPQNIRMMNKWIKDYAAKNGFGIIDFYTGLVDAQGLAKEGLTADGVHPNVAGYAIMRGQIRAFLKTESVRVEW